MTTISGDFSKIDSLLDEWQSPDAFALLMIYMFLANNQGTNLVRCTTTQILLKTGWAQQRFSRAKQLLIHLEFISDERHKKLNSRYYENYIKVHCYERN